ELFVTYLQRSVDILAFMFESPPDIYGPEELMNKVIDIRPKHIFFSFLNALAFSMIVYMYNLQLKGPHFTSIISLIGTYFLVILGAKRQQGKSKYKTFQIAIFPEYIPMIVVFTIQDWFPIKYQYINLLFFELHQTVNGVKRAAISFSTLFVCLYSVLYNM
ncbi:hypothetical protein ACJX0J_024260, partial [Zea mays]